MRILFIGGTRFVGLHTVQAALSRGHEVTLFNRGSNRQAFPGVEQLIGDREGDLSALAGRRWDAVVDTPGYLPRVVQKSAEALRGSIERYLFVSTLSVYAGFSKPGIDEKSELATLTDPSSEQVTGETYGGLKVLCERAVGDAYGERALTVRPGYIVGPHDPTDRFTYYPVRMARGGTMVAPGGPDGPLQVIDGRDLATFMVSLIEKGASGRWNATGPAEPLTWGTFLAACGRVAGPGAAKVAWASEHFLASQGAVESAEFPLWAPAGFSGLHQVSIEKAKAEGIGFRPLESTIRDTLVWRSGNGAELGAGPSPEREAELLDALRRQGGSS